MNNVTKEELLEEVQDIKEVIEKEKAVDARATVRKLERRLEIYELAIKGLEATR